MYIYHHVHSPDQANQIYTRYVSVEHHMSLRMHWATRFYQLCKEKTCCAHRKFLK